MSAALRARAVVDEAEWRLERWGRLARGRYEDLGIGEESVLARMMAEGAGAAQGGDWAAQHLPDDVLETDRAVAKLPRRYKRAVRLHYMTDYDTATKCKILHTGRSSFFLVIQAAKSAVADELRLA